MDLIRFNRIVRQVLLLPVLALLLTSAALYRQMRTADRTVGLIQDSDAAIAQTARIGAIIVDQESGLRGYQTTGDVRFLAPYQQVKQSLVPAFERLQRLISNDPTQTVAIGRLRTDDQTWTETFAEPIITIIRSGGDGHDVDLNLSGKVQMDKIRMDLAAIVQNTEQRRNMQVAYWRHQNRVTAWVLLGLALTVGALIGTFSRNRLHTVSDAYKSSLVTLNRQAQEIFLSEQQLRTTLASIGDGVIACDAEGRITMMNDVACALTGWSAVEARLQPLEHVFHIVSEWTRERLEDPVAKVKRLDRIIDLADHTLLIRKDGSELHIADSGAPIRDSRQAITGIVLVFRDVTLERNTREALMANEKLAVAGRLAATIAHEIHNPLDSVANLLYLLSAGATPEESAQFLEMAQQELARVTQISRAMLSLYRESTAPVTVDVKDMVEGTLLLLDRRIQDLGIVVETRLPERLVVAGFPAELRQVFTNLITNAADAAGQGGSLLVTAKHVSAGAAYRTTEGETGEVRPDGVVIEIVDNGPGISGESLPRLFQPFFTTKGEKGTGLGLWVSRGIIRKHGGSIELINRVGRSEDGQVATRGTIARVFLATRPVITPGGD